MTPSLSAASLLIWFLSVLVQSNGLVKLIPVGLHPFAVPKPNTKMIAIGHPAFIVPKPITKQASVKPSVPPADTGNLQKSVNAASNKNNAVSKTQALIDNCPRDEVRFTDGKCYKLLTRGPCALDEFIILDLKDDKPICALRLCEPGRVFVFADQLCHHPRDGQVCSAGKELYTSMYGTPVCQCPDGTYERNTTANQEVCETLLRPESCPRKQVFWFRDFTQPPRCLADPCDGKNLDLDPDEFPFLPFTDGKCYRLGTRPDVCPKRTKYAISLETLRGVCSTPEDVGFQQIDGTAPKAGGGQNRIRRDTPLPPASPPRDLAPRLASCPAGVPSKHMNKCRHSIILRTVYSPPVGPSGPAKYCPVGKHYNMRRKCVPAAKDVVQQTL